MQRPRNKREPARRDSAPGPDEEPHKDMTSRFLDRSRSSQPLADDQFIRSRRELILRIKDQIRKGEYETEEKLSIAIDRLIDDVLRRRNGG